MVTLVASLLVEVPARPAAAATPTPTHKPSCPASLPDKFSAMTTARMCGGKVRIGDAESPTVEVYAMPDGTLQDQRSMAPVRVHQADGSWRPVDLTLRVNNDGSVSPAMSAFGVTFSGPTTSTAAHQLASVGSGAEQVAIGWTGALPAPVLSGNTATYQNVRPGIDLVVSALTAGIEQNIVVKSRAALSQIAGLSLPVTAAAESSYAPDAGGGFSFKDSHGRAFAHVPGMLMWDAANNPATGQPIRRALRGTLSRLTGRTGKASGVNLALAPDAAWLNDPARQFPITLDPVINPESTTFDTFVQQGSSTDYSGYGQLELGVTSGNITRSFLSWDMTGMEHATINSATIHFYNWYSQSCTSAQWEVWQSGPGSVSPPTTWATQPSPIAFAAPSTDTHGFSSSCDDNWSNIDGKNFFQDAANTGASRGYMELKATDESPTSIGFKEFYSRNIGNPSVVPYAVVNYTSTPVIGTRSTTPSVGCVTGSNRPYISSKTPTLKAVVTQGDGATSTVNFEWWVVGGSKIGGASPTGIVSGNTAQATVPSGAFTEGNNYKWRVDAQSGTATSAWSSWCEFAVDTTAPSAAPTATSTTYPAGGWGGGAGTAGTFTLGANGVADVSSYLYGLDANPPTTAVAASTLGGTATPSITPSTNGPHTLYVQSVDRAGNKSAVTSYAFNVGSGSSAAALVSPTTGTTTAKFTQVQGAAQSGVTGATFQWRRADTDTWTNIPTSDVTYSGGGAVSGWPVAVTSGLSSTLNWNVRQTLANANSPSGLNGRWLLNDQSGSTAIDCSGAGHNATATSVTWSGAHGGSAAFNGTTSQVTTAGQILNTAASFTVSAWAYLTSNTANNVIVSQSATQQSGFDLRFKQSNGTWVFGRYISDTTSPGTFYTAGSTAAASLNTWTNIVGVYTASSGLMQLYVNGVLQTNTGTDTTPINATGPLVIGHGMFNGAANAWFNGNIADVQTYSSALTGTQVAALYTGAATVGSGAALAGPVETRAVFTGGPGGTSPNVTILYDPNSTQAATTPVGPGAVNLVTGELSVGATDASVGSSLTLGRSFGSRAAGTFDTTHMYGPGWTSSATVSAAGTYTGLTVVGSLVQVGTANGASVGFTAATTPGAFVPQVGAEDLTLTYTSGTDTYTLADRDGNQIAFTHLAGTPSGQYAPTSATAPGSNRTTAVSWRTATVDGVTAVQPTQVLAPLPAGVASCATLVRGCQALGFTYATSTTATGTTQATWGDFTGRVKTVSYTAWDPATSAMNTVAVAAYDYDVNGRLTAAWDPRLDNGATHLWTMYAYNTDGTIASITKNTQPAWNLTYTTIPGDNGAGRLASASRSALSAGTATTTVVYGVPVTPALGGPYDMSSGQTARWDEQSPPAQATAVFDAGQVPTGNQASGVLPTSWTRATVTYLDANSRSVNVVTPGGYTTTSWYDPFGNLVGSLTAADRAEALNASSTDTAAQEAALADSLSTSYTYDSTGTLLTTTLGPQHLVTLSTGDVVAGRDLTADTYDQGATAGVCPCGLPTTIVAGTRWWDSGGTSHDADTRTSTITYDWTLFVPLVVTIDPSGLALTTTMAYDASGRTTSVTTPAGGATTNTPSTRSTVYYTTAANGTWPECGGHAEWAGLACRVGPGGQAATGPEVPAVETTYDLWGDPSVVTERTSAGVLRTTTYTYDAAARPTRTSVAGAAGTGTAVPDTGYAYDPATGDLLHVQQLSGSTVVAQTTTGYDTLDRVTSYTDTDGSGSTIGYDLLSHPTTVSDGQAVQTVTYDAGGEARGLATSMTDTGVGTLATTYDPDGRVATETWPDGIVVTRTYDETGMPTGVSYARPGCGQSDCTLYTQTATVNATGDVAGDTSTLSAQQYSYDANDRLTTVADTVGGQCVTRAYGFGSDAAGRASDRTALSIYGPAADGTCQTTTAASSTTWTYDTADRVNTTGYTYDSLGRTTTVPAADTQSPDGGAVAATYYVNDMVASLQQGTGAVATYTLDTNGRRIRSWVDTQGVTHTNHYIDNSDVPRWTDEGGGVATRTVAGSGAVAASVRSSTPTWLITDLHGDVVAMVNGADTAIDQVSESDEYGNLRNGAQVGTLRYEYLGDNQRPADNPAGITLMGARLYNPTTGRFLSVDPMYGGNANPYCYPANPVNTVDPSGEGSVNLFYFRLSWGPGWFSIYFTGQQGARIRYLGVTPLGGLLVLLCGLVMHLAGIICALIPVVVTPVLSYYTRNLEKVEWRNLVFHYGVIDLGVILLPYVHLAFVETLYKA